MVKNEFTIIDRKQAEHGWSLDDRRISFLSKQTLLAQRRPNIQDAFQEVPLSDNSANTDVVNKAHNACDSKS
jgi:hypothetical protein